MANYLGTNDGVTLIYNGVEVSRSQTKTVVTRSVGDGRIVVGRYKTNANTNYVTMHIDELMFFDQSLSSSLVQAIYNSV